MKVYSGNIKILNIAYGCEMKKKYYKLDFVTDAIKCTTQFIFHKQSVFRQINHYIYKARSNITLFGEDNVRSNKCLFMTWHRIKHILKLCRSKRISDCLYSNPKFICVSHSLGVTSKTSRCSYFERNQSEKFIFGVQNQFLSSHRLFLSEIS